MIDTHCHLFDKPLVENYNKLIIEAKNLGISGIAVMSTTEQNWLDIVNKQEQVKKFLPNSFFALGIHPWFVKEIEKGWENKLEQLLSKVDAIGEIGLDKGSKSPDLKLQLKPFYVQMELAQTYHKPVCIHAVKSHDLIQKYLSSNTDVRGIMHAYSGSPSLAKFYIEKGWKLGFGGGLLRENAHRLRRILSSIPLEAIVLETDSPYMGVGVQLSGESTPLGIVEVAKAVSEIKKLPLTEVIDQTTLNTLEIFNLK